MPKQPTLIKFAKRDAKYVERVRLKKSRKESRSTSFSRSRIALEVYPSSTMLNVCELLLFASQN